MECLLLRGVMRFKVAVIGYRVFNSALTRLIPQEVYSAFIHTKIALTVIYFSGKYKAIYFTISHFNSLHNPSLINTFKQCVTSYLILQTLLLPVKRS